MSANKNINDRAEEGAEKVSQLDPEKGSKEELEVEIEKQLTPPSVDTDNRTAYKGDDSDGQVEWNWRKRSACFFLCTLYTGSQILVYHVGGSLSFIEGDLKSSSTATWLPVANTLAVTVVAPFTGYLQDLFGKRIISLCGAVLLCVGALILATAHDFSQAVAAMAIAGAGAAVGELTGIAGISEVVPVKHRGYSLAVVTAFIIAFNPYMFYCQLLGTRATWRWTAWMTLIYNGITALGLFIFYHPQNHVRAAGNSYSTILRKIDYPGGFLSIVGLTLFLVALQAGGYTHPWSSAYVICCFIIGFILIVLWIVWEVKFARYPMIPREIFQGQRIVANAFAAAFVAGMNFYSIINFIPLTWSSVYPNEPMSIAEKGLAQPIGTTLGAIIFNMALSMFRNRNREVLLTAAVIMTAFTGSLAASTPNNAALTVALVAIGSIGVGGMIVPTATVTLLVTPDTLLTTVTALSLAIRTVGASIGYTIYYNVFVNKLTTKLPAYVAEYAVAAGLPIADAESFVTVLLTDPTAITNFTGLTPKILEGAQLGSRWAYAESLKYVWFTSIPFGVCAIIVLLFMPSTAKYQTNRVAVAL